MHWLCWWYCVYKVLVFIYKSKCLNISDEVDNFLFSDLKKIMLFEKALENICFSERLSILFYSLKAETSSRHISGVSHFCLNLVLFRPEFQLYTPIRKEHQESSFDSR